MRLEAPCTGGLFRVMLFPFSSPTLTISENDSAGTFLESLRLRGVRSVAGIDEAGRGPLAGPVVAAAVILGERVPEGIDDSKKLSPARRERLHDEIRATALTVGVGIVDAGEIDRLNILQATLLAMRRAVDSLSIPADHLLVDGNHPIPGFSSQTTVVGGDARFLPIAAASIIAKVTRDRIMDELHRLYPAYGFDRHRGYGTRHHLDAIARHGVSPVHRTTFAGVREHLPQCPPSAPGQSSLF